jgi:carboxyl-terminal processing protease
MQKNKLLLLVIALLLTLGAAVFFPTEVSAAEDPILTEVRSLLVDYYVDKLPPEALTAGSVAELLKILGDPDTEYMTKAYYDHFMGSIENRSDNGMIGVVVAQEARGLLVDAVLEGYSAAERGLQSGDIIITVNGQSLAGKSLSEGIALLQGPEASLVDVVVLRGEAKLPFTLTRRIIETPLVNSELLDGHIGYIELSSFGENMSQQFGEHVQKLQSAGADSWLLDLRDNTGGYTDEALMLLGYYIGESRAIYIEDYMTSEEMISVPQDFTITGKTVVLTNGFSASASEVVVGALRDYGKALLVGGNTYGSGRVKWMIELSNGDYLKLTAYRFFSPNHGNIDKVGIAPQVPVNDSNSLLTGLLFLQTKDQATLAASTGDTHDYLKVETTAGSYVLPWQDMRTEEFWTAAQSVLSAPLKFYQGTASGWKALENTDRRWALYYEGYENCGHIYGVPVDKVLRLSPVSTNVNWSSANPDTMELINARNGKRLPYTLREAGAGEMLLTPNTALADDSEYWLVMHGLRDINGQVLPPGIAVIRTMPIIP